MAAPGALPRHDGPLPQRRSVERRRRRRRLPRSEGRAQVPRRRSRGRARQPRVPARGRRDRGLGDAALSPDRAVAERPVRLPRLLGRLHVPRRRRDRAEARHAGGPGSARLGHARAGHALRPRHGRQPHGRHRGAAARQARLLPRARGLRSAREPDDLLPARRPPGLRAGTPRGRQVPLRRRRGVGVEARDRRHPDGHGAPRAPLLLPRQLHARGPRRQRERLHGRRDLRRGLGRRARAVHRRGVRLRVPLPPAPRARGRDREVRVDRSRRERGRRGRRAPRDENARSISRS